MDKKYAQQQSIPSIFWYYLFHCKILIEIQLVQGPWFILYIYFSFLLATNHNLHAFFLDIFRFPIIINLPWMKNKFTTIKLKLNISTINFEQFGKMNKPITAPEAMETNWLTEINSSGRFPLPLLVKTGNYRSFSVKEIPDEGEPDSIIEEFPIFKKENSLVSVTREKRKPETLKKREKFPEEELVKRRAPRSPVQRGLPKEELVKRKGPRSSVEGGLPRKSWLKEKDPKPRSKSFLKPRSKLKW